MDNRTASFDIGRVMSSTFSVIAKHPIVFLGLSLIISGLPLGLMQYFLTNEDVLLAFVEQAFSIDDASGSGVNSISGWLFGAVAAGLATFITYILLTTLLQAMLIVATVRDIKGQDVDIGVCFMQAIGKLLPLLGLAFLSMICIIFGLLLLIVPGVILMLMWLVATPVMMTENLGIIESLKRSADLTSGSKGMIFLLFIIFIVGSSMISGLAEGAAFFNSTASVIITMITETASGAVQAAGIAALYIELRTVKEGPLTDSLAEVFA